LECRDFGMLNVGMLNVSDFLSHNKRSEKGQIIFSPISEYDYIFLKSQTEKLFFSSILNLTGNLQ
jgi:hypothetical protein